MLQLPDDETDNIEKPTYPELRGELEVDVVVVGGGITGLNTAYLLKKSGFKVAVVEKHTLASGTTGGTTGKVTSQHSLIYAMLADRFGEEMAGLYGQANQQAIDQIEQVVKLERLNCNWERDDNYVYTADPGRVAEFKQEAKIAARLGLLASFETNLPLPIKVKGAVKFANQAKIQAKLYVQGLGKVVQGGGSHVFENSNVIEIRNDHPTRIRTSHGTIFAKDIVVATKVPASPLFARLSYCFLEYPTTSYIVATQIKKPPFKGMYISPDRDNYSILPVGYDKDYFLLVGGENHLPAFPFHRKHYQKLADYAEEYLGVKKIDFRWRAMDYLAYDDVPLIGRVYGWSDHLYTATAFHKWGLTTSMIAANIIRDQITGQPNPYADIFKTPRYRPMRYIPSAVAGYFKS